MAVDRNMIYLKNKYNLPCPKCGKVWVMKEVSPDKDKIVYAHTVVEDEENAEFSDKCELTIAEHDALVGVKAKETPLPSESPPLKGIFQSFLNVVTYMKNPENIIMDIQEDDRAELRVRMPDGKIFHILIDYETEKVE